MCVRRNERRMKAGGLGLSASRAARSAGGARTHILRERTSRAPRAVVRRAPRARHRATPRCPRSGRRRNRRTRAASAARRPASRQNSSDSRLKNARIPFDAGVLASRERQQRTGAHAPAMRGALPVLPFDLVGIAVMAGQRLGDDVEGTDEEFFEGVFLRALERRADAREGIEELAAVQCAARRSRNRPAPGTCRSRLRG